MIRLIRNIKRFVENHYITLGVFLTIVLAIIALVTASRNNQSEGVKLTVVYEPVKITDHISTIAPANVLPKEEEIFEEFEEIEGYERIEYSKDWSFDDAYLLAKIAMAEAEGESLETKVQVILVVLNRVFSNEFPDSIEEVIFQKNNGIYQFSPTIPGGRWWKVEPNEECWEAVDVVSQLKYDISDGALYFEACKGESWHSNNLEFIHQKSNTRFYR